MFSLRVIKGKTLKTIVFIFITILISSYFYFSYENNENNLIEAEMLEEKIILLGELTTLQYNYTNILHYGNSLEIHGYEIPFTKKSFLIKYEGYIKAGIDLKTIHIELHGDNGVSLSLNHAEFTDNVISEDRVKVYDEKSGLFNKIMLDDAFNILDDEKRKTENQLRQSGFLEQANDKTIKLLTPLLKEMGFEDIRFYFI